MKLSQFKFKLPEEKIALHPTRYRDESRLMVLHRKTGEIEHRMLRIFWIISMIRMYLSLMIRKYFPPVCTATRKDRCTYRGISVA